MHEISLVQSLLSQLSELAEQNNAKRITKVTMEVGVLSGVVIDSFRFGFEVLTAEDPLTKGAELELVIPPVIYTCCGCGYQISTTEARPRSCPECNEQIFTHKGSEDLILLQVAFEEQ
jgi:hydrogenase nickel insertion protein HypA